MIELKVGGLYSYPNPINIYADWEDASPIAFMEADEPFVFFEEVSDKGRWFERYRVLTTQGVVGWINIGHPDNVREFKEQP